MKLFMSVFLIFCILVASSPSAQASPQGPFLESFMADMPTDGSEVKTQLPLRPYRDYLIEIISPYSLRDFFSMELYQVGGVWMQLDDSFVDPNVPDITHNGSGFVINDQPTGPYQVRAGTGYVGRLGMKYKGVGEPLRIRMAADYRSVVAWAQIRISLYSEAVSEDWVPQEYRDPVPPPPPEVKTKPVKQEERRFDWEELALLPGRFVIMLCILGVGAFFIFIISGYAIYAQNRRREEQVIQERSDRNAEEKDFFTEEEYQQAKLAGRRSAGHAPVKLSGSGNARVA